MSNVPGAVEPHRIPKAQIVRWRMMLLIEHAVVVNLSLAGRSKFALPHVMRGKQISGGGDRIQVQTPTRNRAVAFRAIAFSTSRQGGGWNSVRIDPRNPLHDSGETPRVHG